LFKKHHIGHIPVVKHDAIVGVLSSTDLLRIGFADTVDESENTVDALIYKMFTLE
jgi:CBS domain-containing membrane protein